MNQRGFMFAVGVVIFSGTVSGVFLIGGVLAAAGMFPSIDPERSWVLIFLGLVTGVITLRARKDLR